MKNSFYLQINFLNKNPTENYYDVDLNSESWVIRVTHDNYNQLNEKNVLKIFRRFGRVVDIRLNNSQQVCEVEYKTAKDIQKAIKAITKDKFFGFKLTDGQYDVSKDSQGNHQTLDKKNVCDDAQQPAHFHSNPYLVIINSFTVKITSNKNYSIRDICNLFFETFIPKQLAEAYDYNTQQCFYLASFGSLYQAQFIVKTFNLSIYKIKGVRTSLL